jgi:hypothetical protein
MKRITNHLSRDDAFWSSSLQRDNHFWATSEGGKSPYPCRNGEEHDVVDQYGICARCGEYTPELEIKDT